MKLRDLAAVIMALAALVSSITGLVAVQAKHAVKQVDERLYQQAAEAVGENAERIAALEAAERKSR